MKRIEFFIESFSFMHCILLWKLQTFYHNKLGAMTLFSKFCMYYFYLKMEMKKRSKITWSKMYRTSSKFKHWHFAIYCYSVVYQKKFSNNVWLKFSKNFRSIHGNTPDKYMGVGYAKEHDDDINHPLVWLNRILFKS